ncbi:hypothetical protein [Arthrobacter sp. UYCo732]|uniref:hypothetical protein n=1 Tax=Arthrobacter sp. UYCo732 TaxID=3156336 RepID=UPI003398D27C
MNGYDAATFETRAVAGDWHAAVSVLSRASVDPDVLAALMTDDAHIEVRLALAMRSDVTAEQLAWCAQCESAFMLNRLVAHPTTPLTTVKDIRDRSADREGEVWTMAPRVRLKDGRAPREGAGRASQRALTKQLD